MRNLWAEPGLRAKTVAISGHLPPQAHAVAEKQEPIILIDDLVKKMVPAFVFLAKHHRETAISLVKRLALVEIGREEPRLFPYTVPFPVLALPSWRKEHLQQLRKAS